MSRRADEGALRYARLRVIACAAALLLTACAESPDAAAGRTERSPAADNSALPHLARHGADGVVLSWVTMADDQASLQYSVWGATGWSPARTVATGTDWFVNWADFPSVQPIGESHWSAHWLRRSGPQTYAYDVVVAQSFDAGKSWSEPVSPHRDGTPTEHGFVTLFPLGGQLAAVWLDGRNTVDIEGHGDGTAGMTLRAASLRPDGGLGSSTEIDALTCDCCQTDVALAEAGPVVVYRNRTPQEVRDIYVARWEDGAWSPGRAVADDGWVIDGCPVNGPAADALGQRLAVVWYTGAGGRARVRAAWSDDGGRTFEAPIDIDDARPLGRVDIELLGPDDAAVSWLGRDGVGEPGLLVRRVSRRGALGETRSVVTTSAARAAGFPQMLRSGDALWFAWTDAGSNARRVHVRSIDLASLPPATERQGQRSPDLDDVHSSNVGHITSPSP